MDSTNLRDYRIGIKSGPFFMPAFRTDFKDSHMKKYKILLTISNRVNMKVHIILQSVISCKIPRRAI